MLSSSTISSIARSMWLMSEVRSLFDHAHFNLGISGYFIYLLDFFFAANGRGFGTLTLEKFSFFFCCCLGFYCWIWDFIFLVCKFFILLFMIF